MANEYWVVAYDSGELGSAATSVTISSLNGNTDEEYELITRFVSGAANSNFGIKINNDTTTYGNQILTGNNTTAAAARDTSEAWMWLTNTADNDAGNIAFAGTSLYAKSGYLRTAITKSAEKISTTTVTQVNLYGQSHDDTATEITSLVVLSDQTDGIGVGSRIILLKKASTGTPAWQKVSDTTLGSAATSYTFSSLNGNTDVIYRLTTRTIGNGTNIGTAVNPNNDTGSNYGFQELYNADATTPDAFRGTDSKLQDMAASFDTNEINMSEHLLYAKSGYVRTVLTYCSSEISGTTVSNIALFGQSWNNTTDEITSIVVNGSDTNALNTGTYLCLEKLAL